MDKETVDSDKEKGLCCEEIIIGEISDNNEVYRFMITNGDGEEEEDNDNDYEGTNTTAKKKGLTFPLPIIRIEQNQPPLYFATLNQVDSSF